MSSALDIQIVSHPNLEKIENFFKDASYKETIEFSANFNTRLGLERRLRLPFLDPQTGVAQNHSQLFMDKKQRMPGFRQGQIYTYPAARWRKSRRQYLNKMYRFPERPFEALRKDHEVLTASSSFPISGIQGLNFHGTNNTPNLSVTNPTLDMEFSMALQDESSSLGAIGGDTSDSKESQQLQLQQQQHQLQHQLQHQMQHQHQQQQQHSLQQHQHQLQTHQHQHQHHLQQQQQQQQQKDDIPKEWFYDDMDMQDMDSLEDPKSPADDEYDYDPRYGTKKRRKRAAGRKRMMGESSGPGRRKRNRMESLDISMESLDNSFGSDSNYTPTAKSSGRRPRGTGTRGRRRAKNIPTNSPGDPLHNPNLHMEPPSFESVAAAVADDQSDLRNYRKYL